MKESLKAGIEHELRFRVPDSKTVPALYPESPEFQVMPRVFATGYMIGLIEWARLSGQRPRKAGCNARRGEHGRRVALPIARITASDGTRPALRKFLGYS